MLRLALLFALLLSFRPAVAAPRFALRLDLHGLRQEEVTPLLDFLREVEARVPPRVQAALAPAGPVLVSFVRPPGAAASLPGPPWPCAEPGPARQALELGRTRGAHIRLHRGLLPAILGGAAQEARPRHPCGHGDLHRLATAVLLHEVLHRYDALAGISRRPHYLRLHGFDPIRRPSAAGGGVAGAVARNTLAARSPDPYEFTDAAESFAVNGEFFLLDPDYRCRRPAAYAYLERALGVRPFPHSQCTVNHAVHAGGTRLVLDPGRIYQAHLLLAAAGSEMASRFGHLMVRLLRCAPDRAEVGPPCLEDLQDHVVLGFAADLRGEPGIDPLKGLTGGYTTRLFVKPLTEVIIEYTETEFRALRSLPLRLTREELERLVHRALEVHHSYASRYYFVSNNCAVEAMRLLQAALPDPAVQALRPLTPGGVIDGLIRLGLLDTSAHVAPGIAAADGMVFPSLAGRYEEDFAALRPALPRGAPRSLSRYLASSAAARGRWAEAPALSGSGAAAHLFALEGLILARRERDADRALSRYLHRGADAGLRRRLRAALSGLQLLWTPARGGYGVPLPHEMPAAPSSGARRALRREIDRILGIVAPAQDEELRATRENRRRFLQGVLDGQMIDGPT